MVKKIIYTFIISIGIGCIFSACKKELPIYGFSLSVQEDSNYELEEISALFTNINNSSTKRFGNESFANNVLDIKIEKGVYNISLVAKGKTPSGKEISLSASLEAVNISAEGTKASTSLNVIYTGQDLVIAEIFYTGTLTPEGKQYNGDNYFVLRNISSDTVYADGVAILESEFLTVNDYNYKPDVMDKYFIVEAVYVIPGSGKDHPIPPLGEIVIADNAIDHREANPQSFDLSKANWEWYDESSNPNFLDVDNPAVPNLDKWYCYTLTTWSLHNRGFRSYAIARMQCTKEEFLLDYTHHYEYDLIIPGRDPFPMSQDAYKVPNSWILDAVNLSVESEFKKIVTDKSLDMGWTYCGKINSDPDRYGKAVRRLKDSNNSTVDFEAETTPIFAKQNTSKISRLGRKFF